MGAQMVFASLAQAPTGWNDDKKPQFEFFSQGSMLSRRPHRPSGQQMPRKHGPEEPHWSAAEHDAGTPAFWVGKYWRPMPMFTEAGSATKSESAEVTAAHLVGPL